MDENRLVRSFGEGHQADRGRPMLSAIAVGVSGSPGDGFFGLAKTLGKFVGSGDVRSFGEGQVRSNLRPKPGKF